ncbi:MAG: protease PrsW [Thermoplasmatales archaeon]|nr:MAG: protease PrsW [Thermoplasmatales archaeon]
MDIIPQASLFLGIIPALFLLFISLKGYEGLYKEKNIFLTFVVGIVLGFIAAFVQSVTFALAIIYIILLAFFDQLIKTIILNLGRFHKKKETVIYGMSLGLGFGSSFTPFLIIAVSSIITNDVYVLTLIAIGSLGIILFHGATGAYIGYGIYVGKLIKHLLYVIIFQLPFNFILGMMIAYSDAETLDVQFVFVASLIIYGTVVFCYVIKNIMPKIIQKSKRRIKKRKKGF